MIRVDMVLSSEDQDDLMVLLDRLNEFIEEEIGKKQPGPEAECLELKAMRKTSEKILIRIEKNARLLTGRFSPESIR